VTRSMELRDRSRDEAGIIIRAAAEADGSQFVGHAAVFNSRTAIGNPLTWGFYEEINAGAFTKTLKEGDARFLVDHDTSLLVARVSAGDLRLGEDDLGLAVDSDLDTEVSYVRDLIRNVDKRRITGMSFGFQVVKDDWKTEEVETNDGNSAEVEIRTIQEVRLFEVSAVTFPAYEETDAAVRALALRDDPDPLGRRSHLIDRITEGQREPGGSTRAPKSTEPAAARATPLSLTHADLVMQGLASRYGLTTTKS
jgi:HK97 family phage prohead protease